MAPFKIEGFVPATFTPFGNNGELNLGAIDSYQMFLFNKGIKYIYVNGSTGEGPSLTTEERKQTCEVWMKYCRLPGREMKVIVQVGGCSFKDTEDLTRHAVALNVDAISTLPSLYFTPSTVDELVDFCKCVGELAPDTPLYYYNIPDRTGVKFDMAKFLENARDVIPTLRGIKFSSKDIYEGSKCLHIKDRHGHLYDMLYGSDEQVMSAFAIGFHGAIGSTYNFMPTTYQLMSSALEVGHLEEARTHQYKSIATVNILFGYGKRTGGLLAACRVIMTSLGIDIGPPRYPIMPLSIHEKEELLQTLAKHKLIDSLK